MRAAPAALASAARAAGQAKAGAWRPTAKRATASTTADADADEPPEGRAADQEQQPTEKRHFHFMPLFELTRALLSGSSCAW